MSNIWSVSALFTPQTLPAWSLELTTQTSVRELGRKYYIVKPNPAADRGYRGSNPWIHQSFHLIHLTRLILQNLPQSSPSESFCLNMKDSSFSRGSTKRHQHWAEVQQVDNRASADPICTTHTAATHQPQHKRARFICTVKQRLQPLVSWCRRVESVWLRAVAEDHQVFTLFILSFTVRKRLNLKCVEAEPELLLLLLL